MTRELEGKIMDNEDLVREYSNNLTTYEQFTNLMETYICNLLNREQISFHSITSRTKSIESLSKKIELKNKYQKLDEITDLSGIRVITYYTDTVDQISKLIENEFIIDRDNSIDKRKSLDPKRFGYRSLHYVVQIDPKYVKAQEYLKYHNLKLDLLIFQFLTFFYPHLSGFNTCKKRYIILIKYLIPKTSDKINAISIIRKNTNAICLDVIFFYFL